MTDRDIVSQDDRKTPAGMHNAVVLDVRPVPDDDPVLVGPNDSPEPDPYLFSQRDIAGNSCIAGPEERFTGDLSIHMHNNIGN